MMMVIPLVMATIYWAHTLSPSSPHKAPYIDFLNSKHLKQSSTMIICHTISPTRLSNLRACISSIFGLHTPEWDSTLHTLQITESGTEAGLRRWRSDEWMNNNNYLLSASDTSDISINPPSALGGRDCYYPHLTDAETEGEKNWVIF